MDQDGFLRAYAPQLRAGNGAVLCGAGVSVPSSLPDWETLLSDAREELQIGKDYTNLSLLATYYVTNVDGGRSRLTKSIRRQLTDGPFQPNDVHRALWRLPVRYLWSLNFDDLLEAAYMEERGVVPRVIQTDSEMEGSLAQGRRSTLIKMHGGFRELEEDGGRRLVITRDDFDTYIDEYPRTWARLLADFYTKSMLFIGISFADPNMQTLLRLVRQANRKVTQQHYAVMRVPGSDATKESVALHRLQAADLRRGGVEPVEMPSYNELPNLLKRTAVQARQPAVMLAGSLERPDPKITALLQALGTLLATSHSEILLVHGGSATIRDLPIRFAEHLERTGTYADHRIIQVRRCEAVDHRLTVEERRLGSIVFPGTDHAAVRTDLCSRAAICLVVGGQKHTQAEVDECVRQGVRIFPVPVGIDTSGRPLGYSQDLWEDIASKSDKTAEDDEVAGLHWSASSDSFVMAERIVAAIVRHLFPGAKP